MMLPPLESVETRWFHDETMTSVFRASALAMCFGLLLALALFMIEETWRH